MRSTRLSLLFILVASSAIAACGGDDGGGVVIPDAPPVTPDAPAALMGLGQLRPRDHIEISALCQHQFRARKQLKVRPHPARRAATAPSDHIELAAQRRVNGQNAIGLIEIDPPEDDCIGLVKTFSEWCRHWVILAWAAFMSTIIVDFPDSHDVRHPCRDGRQEIDTAKRPVLGFDHG